MIDTWPMSYHAPWGDKYVGKLMISNKRLVFIPDNGGSYPSRVPELMTDYMELLKENIMNVKQQNTLFSKKIIVTLADNSSHIFNYGVMNTDKILEAIKGAHPPAPSPGFDKLSQRGEGE